MQHSINEKFSGALAGMKITGKTLVIIELGGSGDDLAKRAKALGMPVGEQHHSSQHPGGEAFKDKKCIVLGGNNSAHDICCALWENDADVTMIQRSSTHIIKPDSLMEVILGGLYSEEAVESGMTTHKADLTFASVPFQIMPQFHIPAYQAVAERDAEFYQRLTDAGFLLDFGEDGSGLFMKYLRRGSGY